MSDYDNQDLETLSLFMRNVIDINSILEAAEETYFLDNFDEALYDAMVNPSEDLIRIIYANMGGKRKSDKIYLLALQENALLQPVSPEVALETAQKRLRGFSKVEALSELGSWLAK